MDNLEKEIVDIGLDDLITKYSLEIKELEERLKKKPNDDKTQKNYYALLKDYSMLLSKKEAREIIDENRDDKIIVEFINLKSYAEYKKGLKK